MKLWLWTLTHLQTATDADGAKLYHKSRQSVTFPLADALCWLLAARQFILDVLELEAEGRGQSRAWPTDLPGFVNFFTDLCHVQSARAAGEVGRICAELVYGYNRHPAWDEASCNACYSAEELESLEGIIPGIDGSARDCADVTEANEAHPLQSRSVREAQRPGDPSCACAPSWTAA